MPLCGKFNCSIKVGLGLLVRVFLFCFCVFVVVLLLFFRCFSDGGIGAVLFKVFYGLFDFGFVLFSEFSNLPAVLPRIPAIKCLLQ